MSDVYNDEMIETSLRLYAAPISDLESLDDEWLLGNVHISKQRRIYRTGYAHDLTPESRFRKQWFAFPAMAKQGWAVIFRAFEPRSVPGQPAEYFAGWVPPERVVDVDRWIAVLNKEIQNRLAGRQSHATTVSNAQRTPVSSPLPKPRNLPRPHAMPSDKYPMLIPVGCYVEMGYRGGPSLIDERGKRSTTNKDSVLRYLRSAPALNAHLAVYEDYFDAAAYCGSLSLRTDGRFVWPDYLAYYLQRYDVALPAEFEAFMEDNSWSPPEIAGSGLSTFPRGERDGD